MKRLIAALAVIFIAGCNQKENLNFEEYNDMLIGSNLTTKVGTVNGLKAIYCLYGKTPSGLTAGVAISPSHKFYFRIKTLVDQNPSLAVPLVLKAEAQQEKRFNGK